jgi:hypothetical protein
MWNMSPLPLLPFFCFLCRFFSVVAVFEWVTATVTPKDRMNQHFPLCRIHLFAVKSILLKAMQAKEALHLNAKNARTRVQYGNTALTRENKQSIFIPSHIFAS